MSLNLFTPKVEFKDYLEKINNVKLLFKIVKKNEYSSIHNAAFKKILNSNNEKFLSKIAKKTIYSDIGIAVLKKIQKNNLLINIVLKSYCYEVQVEALKKLDLDKWGKILMDKIKEKRLKIYLQIETTYQSENQNFIEEIARKHEDKYIRRVAISRIKDKNILFDIAKNDDENSLEATMKLTDINNIAYIYEMKKGNIGYTPEYKLQQKLANIIKKIKDIDLLIDISENNEYSICREEAIKRISDQNVLFDIAKNNENIRAKAVERITDQKLLIDIINNFEGEDIRRNVTEKIRDEKTLIDLAKNDKGIIEPIKR